MTACIELRGVCVDYRLRGRQSIRSRVLHAVCDVDLRVDKATAIGIVGESGSGKSSLVRSIVGLVPPTRGEILLDGEPLSPVRTRETRRRMQMVFQDPGSSLNPALRIGGVLDELLRFDQPNKALRRQRARELVGLVGLPEEVLAQRPLALSGGQRQRIGLARALATGADILVADEPTSALDVSVQAIVLNLLRNLKEKLNLTLILVSHNLAVVRNVCDEVVVMRDGCVVECGPADELFRRPHHEYTKALIGAVPEFERCPMRS
jgi:peptide/nickel transport system ATP-binding protein